MNQLRQDKDFPVYKDYLDGKLLSGEITEDEHHELVKKADAEDKLFSRRNRGVVDQMIKQLHYKNTEEETKRHNKTSEGIQQQNADTREGQYKETVRNNDIKNNQTQQKINLQKNKADQKNREDAEKKIGNGKALKMKDPNGVIHIVDSSYKKDKESKGWVAIN